MIDFYLLEELATFAQAKTFAKTAQELNVSQPTITRGMQKLEDLLGVKLFDRQKNQIVLTQTGKIAAQKATELVNLNENFVSSIRDYDRGLHLLRLASIAPGPLILANKVAQENATLSVDKKLIKADQVNSGLLNHQFEIILNNKEVQNDQIESLYLGKEQLNVNLDEFLPAANQTTVKFSDLADLHFILNQDIGPWKQIVQDQIPKKNLFYQPRRYALNNLAQYSNFPYFSTNIAKLDIQKSDEDDRVSLPISDQAATMEFYASYLKENRKRVKPILTSLVKIWPQL